MKPAPTDWLSTFIIALAIALVVILVVALEAARWRECRRVHPAWYCFVSVGK